MIILKSFSFYLSLIGILLIIVFSHIKGRPVPDSTYVQEPATSPFTHYLAASGIVESIDKNIIVGSFEDGVVEQLWVKVGDKVEKGNPLFRLDTRNLEADLLTKKANYRVSKHVLDEKYHLFQRIKDPKDQPTVSQEEFQTRQDELWIAEAKLKEAEAEILRIQHLIDRFTVRAPKAGTILQVNIRVGEYVAQNSSSIILGDIDHLQMRVSIDEQNAGKFNIHSKAVAFPKNNTSIEIPLTFVRIEPYVIPKKSLTGVSEERVDTRVLEVIYAFHEPTNYHMYVGQQADIFIESQEETSGQTNNKKMPPSPSSRSE